ncbi:MAG: hypothetical protein Q9220_006937 [cf. Caloplaca sp. 1 TL-2023]
MRLLTFGFLLANIFIGFSLASSLIVRKAINCRSNFHSAPLDDCIAAMEDIDRDETYTAKAQFGYGHCLVVYSPRGKGHETPISGEDVWWALVRLIDVCSEGGTDTKYGILGSAEAGNCRDCRVRIEYTG